MFSMSLKSREQLIEDIKCLETELMKLRGRFEVIVSWIRSQYDDELSGLPEYLVIAVRGDQSQGLSVEKEFSTVDVKVECVIDSDDRDENFLAKTNDQTLKNIELESSYPDHQTVSPFLFVGSDTLKLENNQTAVDNSADQTVETIGSNPLANSKKSLFGNLSRIRINKNADFLQANKEKGFVVDADEYIRMTESLPKTRQNCVICDKKFPTLPRLRRHELEVHLVKEDQIVVKERHAAEMAMEMSERKKSSQSNPTRLRVNKNAEALQANKAKGLVVEAHEYMRMTELLPKTRQNCVICDKVFPNRQGLRRHELGVHLVLEDQIRVKNILAAEMDIEMEMCDICNKPYRNIESHKNFHLPPEVIVPVEGRLNPYYRCLKCNEVMPNRRSYINHMATVCKEDKETLKQPDVDQEMEELRNEKNFLCTECGQAFNRKYTLKIHVMAIHAKRKDFKCQYCDMAFTVECNKKSHERKHLGTASVTCDMCGFTFTCKQILKKHIRGVHENRRPYPCRLCDKSFKTANARDYHINTHGNPNGRKRGLNRDVDPVKAAAKRRQSAGFMKNRLQKVVLADTKNEKSLDGTS